MAALSRRAALAAGAVAVMAAPAAATTANDSALLAHLRRAAEVGRQAQAAWEAAPEPLLDKPGYDAAEAVWRPLQDQHRAMLEQAARMPAFTPEGGQAKAAAVKDWLAGFPDGELPHFAGAGERLAWSLCMDLLRG